MEWLYVCLGRFSFAYAWMLVARGVVGRSISLTETGVDVALADWVAMSLSSERGTAVKPNCSIMSDMVVSRDNFGCEGSSVVFVSC